MRPSIRSHQLTRSTPARGAVERTWVYACGYCVTLDGPREGQARFTQESPLGDEPEYGCLDPGSICAPHTGRRGLRTCVMCRQSGPEAHKARRSAHF